MQYTKSAKPSEIGSSNLVTTFLGKLQTPKPYRFVVSGENVFNKIA